jgi:hypothetical protein
MVLTTPEDQLTALCIVMFNAAPGANILADLVGAHDAGSSIRDIAEALATKPQFWLVYYPDSTQSLAEAMVDNLLASDTPQDSKLWCRDWLLGKLDSGESTASVLLQAGQELLATTNPKFASAQAQLANKLDVANYYSVTLGESSTWLSKLQNVLEGVTHEPATVSAAKAAIDFNLSGSQELTFTADPNGATTVDVRAAAVDLTIVAPTNSDGYPDLSIVIVDGDSRELTITLTATLDEGRNPASPDDDTYENVSVWLNTIDDHRDLETLTLKGNGSVQLYDDDGTALSIIDASGLSSAKTDAPRADGLVLFGHNRSAETIFLSQGRDSVDLYDTSTVKNPDTIHDYELIENGANSGQIDLGASDHLSVMAIQGFTRIEIQAADLDAALTQAANASEGQNLVFHFGGDTYIYADWVSPDGAESLDDDDLLVKLVGTLDLDLLLDMLNS